MSFLTNETWKAYGVIFCSFCLERALFILIGCYALHHQGVLAYNYTHNLHLKEPPSCAWEIHYRWDAVWYWRIAKEGYGFDRKMKGYEQWEPYPFSSGFFPGMVGLLKLSPTPLGGVFIAWALGFGCLLGLWHVYKQLRVPFLFLCLPTSIFLFTPFAESLLMLGFLIMVLSKEKMPGLAFGAAVSSIAKPIGWALPLLGLSLFASSKERRKGAYLIAGSSVGILFTGVIQAMAFGSPLAFWHRQSLARGMVGGPWTGFVQFLSAPKYLFGWHGSIMDLIFVLLYLLGLGWFFLKDHPFPLWMKGWTGILIGLPICSSFISFSRLALPAFPIPALLRYLPSRYLFAALCAILAVLKAWWIYRYATFQWVG